MFGSISHLVNSRVIFWKIVCFGSGRVSHHRWSFLWGVRKSKNFWGILQTGWSRCDFLKKKFFWAKNRGIWLWVPRATRVRDQTFFCLDILVWLVKLYKNIETKIGSLLSLDHQRAKSKMKFDNFQSLIQSTLRHQPVDRHPTWWYQSNGFWVLFSKIESRMKSDIGLMSNCQKSKFYFQFS